MCEREGHRPKVKITMSKMRFSWILHSVFDKRSKGLSDQGQRPHGLRSKVTVPNKGRWAHINVKLLYF